MLIDVDDCRGWLRLPVLPQGALQPACALFQAVGRRSRDLAHHSLDLAHHSVHAVHREYTLRLVVWLSGCPSCVCNFPAPLQPYITPFLNTYLTWFDKFFPLFGTLSVALFTMYLLLAATQGNFKFGSRFFLISVRASLPRCPCWATDVL